MTQLGRFYVKTMPKRNFRRHFSKKLSCYLEDDLALGVDIFDLLLHDDDLLLEVFQFSDEPETRN